MNKMTAREAAEELCRISRVFDTTGACSYAASILRQYANGELRPAVHAHWDKKYDSGSQNYNSDENWYYVCSKCDGWDKYPEKYCHNCGALMDELATGITRGGKDDNNVKK